MSSLQKMSTGADRLSFDSSSPWRLTVKPETPRPNIVAGYATVIEHDSIGLYYARLVLESPEISATALPGQFVMITVAKEGATVPALPRPMAIFAVDAPRGSITIVYAIVGRGTRKLRDFTVTDPIYVVGPVGREFDIPETTRSVLLVGRGIGTCSLTTVAQHNRRKGIRTHAVTSGRTPDAVVGRDFYWDQGAASVIEVTDADDSSHPDALYATLTEQLDPSPPQLVLTCGSSRLAVLCRKLADRWGATVQVSLEAHMACGIGYCHGCASGAPSVSTESPLVCKDGPVFALESAE